MFMASIFLSFALFSLVASDSLKKFDSSLLAARVGELKVSNFKYIPSNIPVPERPI